MENLKNDLYFIGCNDKTLDLFESHFLIPNGMSYNSYILVDEKIAIFDSVDKHVGEYWIKEIKNILKDKKPDYLIVQHMEPDHSANIFKLLEEYPDITIVGRDLTFNMISNYFRDKTIKNKLEIKDGTELSLGRHNLKFIFAPMIHWPEVFMTYDETSKVLFSADAFGKFGALDTIDNWVDEARRYYFGIVGKYGFQVQQLLKKASQLDIEMICPLHGPIIDKNLAEVISLYDKWSKYESETNGVLIAYTSVYGHTKQAVKYLKEELEKEGVNVEIRDLSRCDIFEAVSLAFKYQNIVLATTTYNMSIFPPMYEFLHHLIERNFQKKNIAIIQNGSWAPTAGKVIKDLLVNQKNINYIEPVISLVSSMSKTNIEQIEDLAKRFVK
ncbi:MAG TPA: flavodoxin [Firmicutes bacterium]|nr:flavodoxin [Bacillota bacterium]